MEIEYRPTNEEGELKSKPEAFKDIAEQIADSLEEHGYDTEEVKMIAEELSTVSIDRIVEVTEE